MAAADDWQAADGADDDRAALRERAFAATDDAARTWLWPTDHVTGKDNNTQKKKRNKFANGGSSHSPTSLRWCACTLPIFGFCCEMSIFCLNKKKKLWRKSIRVSRVGPNANDDSNVEQAANWKKKKSEKNNNPAPLVARKSTKKEEEIVSKRASSCWATAPLCQQKKVSLHNKQPLKIRWNTIQEQRRLYRRSMNK
jgi:hypothetical protein